ncbi:MAG: glycoside hydrolase family 28 protein [Sphingomonas sp.]|uniref:glycoside hydrolase family 28 protein n=1 Tax=Sphingomonas sp. TaxID=28214 RepID=UPI001B0D60D3|nr:glycoside hydrolase family 28 protein [Sphingomonas sp.]MBO9622933.1 glycoside hydrolase family 28 protein [Sphingomonas sp.]
MQLDRRALLGAGLTAPLLAAVPARAALRLPRRSVGVAAPFDMPSVAVPDFSASRRFPITDFGADPGDQAKTGAAIARAIAAANAAGSGVVVVPAGVWPTGKVHLKSNVNLHLAKGATLLFSSNPGDYLPAVPTSWEGFECYNYSPLVYAYDCENVAISGEGRLKARLDVWQLWYARPKPHLDALVRLDDMAARGVPVAERQMAVGEAHLRPHFVQFNRCRNVLVEDISIEDSPFWVLHPFLCRDVVIRRVKVRAHGHNNDGVDPEMSENVLIEDCVFDQGDDAIAIKSGSNQDGWRLGVPSRNIVMRGCRVKNGHQLCAIGSELSAGIENVFVTDCHFERGEVAAPTPINNILFIKTNERRGGFVRNVFVSNVTATKVAGGVLSIDTDVLYQWRNLVPTRERRLTPIENILVDNVCVDEAKFLCSIKGQAELPVRSVALKGVKVGRFSGTPVLTEHVEEFSIR